jgi:hypothetical protein
MEQRDPKQGGSLDPRAVPVAVASVVVIVLGLAVTYESTPLGALIVLLGLIGIVWVAVLSQK